MAANPTVPTPVKPGPTGDKNIGNAPPSMTSAQQDAWAILQNLLEAYGFTGTSLTQLVAWAKGQILAGNGSDLITLELQQTPQFKARFPAIAHLEAEGVAITPAEYISMEQSYAQIEHAAGLPVNFASYNALIANQVSPTEYQNRVTEGYLAVARADPTVVKAFQDFYGVGASGLAAYFLDPNRALPILQQQAVAAQIGGASAMAGFNPAHIAGPEGITQAQAMRVAEMGVNQQTAQTGFQKLATEKQLYTPMVGTGQGRVGNPLSTDQLLNAQFGSDGQTQLQLQLQAAFEKGTTQQGTQIGTTSSGATGVANVQR